MTPRTYVAVLALAGLAVVSCKGMVNGGSSPGGGDNGSITTTDPGAGASTPAPSSVPGTPADVVPIPTGTGQEITPTPIETPAALPSPAVLEAVNAATGKLNGITTGVQGTNVKFVDCNDTAVCTTRLEAKTLTGLRDLLQAVNKEQTAGINFVARENLDAYTGQSFVADVTLGGSTTKPVPTDENELLVNNDSP